MGVSVLECLEAGKIDLLDVGIYSFLILKADGASVTEIHALYPQVSSRTLLRRLGHLEQIGLVKASKTPGKKGLYAVPGCRASVCDTVGDANGITGETATAWHNPATDTVDVLDDDVSASRPHENRPEQRDTGGQATGTQTSTPGNALVELGIVRLADRHRDFVALVEANSRGAGESLGEWAKRMMRLCDERSIFLPRPFFARARDAAA